MRAFENLLPLASYQQDDTGYWGRLRLLGGILFGVAMTVMGFFTFPSRPVVLLLAGVLGGLFFGVIFTWLIRRRVRRYEEGLYKGEGWIVRPLPAGVHPEYQLPATQVIGPQGVGGILYVGPADLTFVPHWLNAGTPEVVSVSLASGVQTALVAPPAAHVLQRFLVPRRRQQILINAEGTELRLVTPEPATTIEKLNQVLAGYKG